MTASDDPQPSREPTYVTAELDEAVRRGTRWVVVAQVASQLVSLVVLAVVYRWVDPAQFGLLGMVVPLLLLAKIFSSLGLHVATVQRRDVSSDQLSAAFWLGVAVSVCVALAMCAAGPALGWFYNTPAVSHVTMALAGTLVIAACGAQHQALLERRLQVGRLATIRLLAQCGGGVVGIGVAVAGLGVWALVAQQYAELLILAALAWYAEAWRPNRPTRVAALGGMLQFGGYYTLSSLFFYVAQNSDKVLLAWWLGGTPQGDAALGMYSQAFNLMMKPVYVVSSPLTGIMLPALSRAAHAPAEFAELVGRFFRMTCIVLLPAGIGLMWVSSDVMQVLGGNTWQPAGAMLLALAPTILLQGLINISGSVLAAAGRADRLCWGALVTAVVLALACVAGGIVAHMQSDAADHIALGVAWGYTIASTLLLGVPYLVFVLRSVHISVRHVARPLVRSGVAALAMGILVGCVQVGLAYTNVGIPTRLILCLVAGVVSYVLIARSELRWLTSQFQPHDVQ
jgi:PST family polysaccharide transporter